ncbi:hypothetical protein ACIBG7_34600 [Nonomuraea sp. NPDC050328]|uniref:hypothetical protein n=1 Tax=Nonomuraea sp. NPDC050328 TaxID=3364361 RepID=UPI003793197D
MTGKKRFPAAAIFGMVIGALGFAVAELAAALIGRPQAGPLVAAGSAFIDLTPQWLKDFAIRTFGTADKLVLLLSLAVGALLVAALMGWAGTRRRPWPAVAVLFGLVAVAGAAALTRPTALLTDIVPSAAAAAAGLAALTLVRRRLLPHSTSTAGDPAQDHPDQRENREVDRRALLITGAGLLGVAALAGGSSRAITALRPTGATMSVLPRPAYPAPPLPPGTDLQIPGMARFITPATGFYRVDTALVIPRVPAQEWTLRVHGLVDRPFELTMGELLPSP